MEKNFESCLIRKNVREDFRNDSIKTGFVIETESVRRMFRAKPSMNVIVVQLLVDLSLINPGETNLRLPNNEKLFSDRSSHFLHETTSSGKDQSLSRLLLTTFAYSKQVQPTLQTLFNQEE